MYFASIYDAFGVDTLENEPRKPINRAKFQDEPKGEETNDEVVEDVVMIPEEKKITEQEVRRYISNMYTKKGLKKVWNLLNPKIKMNILKMCTKSVKNTHAWFESILSSPEKLLIILAIIFVIILLIDSMSSKSDTVHMYSRPSEYYFIPQTQIREPVDLRW